MLTPHPTNPSTNPHPEIHTPLTHELQTRHNLPVTTTWLTSFLSTVRHPPPPLPALASTAHFRLLNSDFTTSLRHTQVFPADISSVNSQHTTLLQDTPVQVLDIVDVGASRLAQVEMIERVERGEEVRGREVIRHVVGVEDGENEGITTTAGTGPVKKSAGPHKLLLQDAAGVKVWGFEMGVLPRVWITVGAEEGGLQIGAKMVLRVGVVVRRGLVMLEPGKVVVLGGRVEEWDRRWRGIRKGRLMDEVKRESETDGTGAGG